MNSLSPLYIQVFDKHFDLLLLSQREWPVTEASLHLWALHLWTLVCFVVSDGYYFMGANM